MTDEQIAALYFLVIGLVATGAAVGGPIGDALLALALG